VDPYLARAAYFSADKAKSWPSFRPHPWARRSRRVRLDIAVHFQTIVLPPRGSNSTRSSRPPTAAGSASQVEHRIERRQMRPRVNIARSVYPARYVGPGRLRRLSDAAERHRFGGIWSSSSRSAGSTTSGSTSLVSRLTKGDDSRSTTASSSELGSSDGVALTPARTQAENTADGRFVASTRLLEHRHQRNDRLIRTLTARPSSRSTRRSSNIYRQNRPSGRSPESPTCPPATRC
jgi:hypothetical protein